MKRVLFLISLSFLSALLVPALADPLTQPKPIDEVRFGEKTKDTLSVVIGGDVAHPGQYFLPKGFGLKSVLGIVGGYGWKGHRAHGSAKTAQFHGRIRIFRSIDGAKATKTEYKISELHQAKSSDVPLLDGDVIEFVTLRIYQE